MAATPAKKRKLNFSDEEISILVQEVGHRKEILFGGLEDNQKGLGKAKKAAWEEVTSKVNEYGFGKREVEEVKKKFSDLRSHVRKRVASIREAKKSDKHRNRPAPPPPPPQPSYHQLAGYGPEDPNAYYGMVPRHPIPTVPNTMQQPMCPGTSESHQLTALEEAVYATFGSQRNIAVEGLPGILESEIVEAAVIDVSAIEQQAGLVDGEDSSSAADQGGENSQTPTTSKTQKQKTKPKTKKTARKSSGQNSVSVNSAQRRTSASTSGSNAADMLSMEKEIRDAFVSIAHSLQKITKRINSIDETFTSMKDTLAQIS